MIAYNGTPERRCKGGSVKKIMMQLRLFDGGEGASSAGTAQGASVTGVAAGDGASASDAQEQSDATTDMDTSRPSFEDLIKGEYKAEADKYIQGIVRARLKDSKRDKDTIKSQSDILSIVASKYGVDPSDLVALKDKVESDDAYYEDRAMEEGLTVDQYKRIAQAESRAKAYEERYQAEERERQTREQVSKWQEEAENLKQVYPDFNLDAEIQNPTFGKLLSMGVDMRSAFVAVHDAEIMEGAMRYTASEVRKATANEIQARGSRPRENASSARASASVRKDVSKLTRADREALSRRALSGETVYLS